MKEKIFISFIVPIYKIPEEFLRKCVESIINQEFKNIEVILIDDESPDNCGEICDEYSLKDSRIKVIHQKNQGVSVARNNGINIAQGEWISFVDADDWIESDYVKKFYDMALNNNSDILIVDCYVNYLTRQVNNKFFREKVLESKQNDKDRFILQFLCNKIYNDNLSTADVGAPWAKIYKREFIINKGLRFNPKLIRMQDNVFNLYAFQEANNLYYEENYLYHYKKSEFSGFSRFTPNIIKYYELVFKELDEFIIRYKKSNKFNIAKNIKIVKSIYVYCKMYFFHKDNKKSKKDVNKELKNLLNKGLYKDAINNVDFKYLSSMEKIFAICLKYNMINSIRLMMKVKEIIFK